MFTALERIFLCLSWPYSLSKRSNAPSKRIIWVLNHLVNRHGKPAKIRMDTGPEFKVKLSQSWVAYEGIDFPVYSTKQANTKCLNGKV